MCDNPTPPRALSFFGSVTTSVVRCSVDSNTPHPSVSRLERSGVSVTLRASLVNDTQHSALSVRTADDKHDRAQDMDTATRSCRSEPGKGEEDAAYTDRQDNAAARSGGGINSPSGSSAFDDTRELFRSTSTSASWPLHTWCSRRKGTRHSNGRTTGTSDSDEEGMNNKNNKQVEDRDDDKNSHNNRHPCGFYAVRGQSMQSRPTRVEEHALRARPQHAPAPFQQCEPSATLRSLCHDADDAWYRDGGQYVHRLYLPVLFTHPLSQATQPHASGSSEASELGNRCSNKEKAPAEYASQQSQHGQPEKQHEDVLLRLCVVLSRRGCSRCLMVVKHVALSPSLSTFAIDDMCALTEVHVDATALRAWLHDAVEENKTIQNDRSHSEVSPSDLLHSSLSSHRIVTLDTSNDHDGCMHDTPTDAVDDVAIAYSSSRQACPRDTPGGIAAPLSGTLSAPAPLVTASTPTCDHIVHEDSATQRHGSSRHSDGHALTLHLLVRVIDLSAHVRAVCEADDEMRRLLSGGNRRYSEGAPVHHTGRNSLGCDKGETMSSSPSMLSCANAVTTTTSAASSSTFALCCSSCWINTAFQVLSERPTASQRCAPYNCMPLAELYRHYCLFYNAYTNTATSSSSSAHNRRHRYHSALLRVLLCHDSDGTRVRSRATEAVKHDRCDDTINNSAPHGGDGDCDARCDATLNDEGTRHLQRDDDDNNNSDCGTLHAHGLLCAPHADALSLRSSSWGALSHIRLDGAVLLGEAAMAPFLCTIAHCPHLRQIHLDHNKLGDWTCGRLCALLSHHNYLQTISLRHNIIHESGATHLVRLVKRCSTLTAVQLEGNPCSSAACARIDRVCALHRAPHTCRGEMASSVLLSSLPDVTPLVSYISLSQSVPDRTRTASITTEKSVRDATNTSDAKSQATALPAASFAASVSAMSGINMVRRASRVWAMLTAMPIGDVDVWTRNSTTTEFECYGDDTTRDVREAAATSIRAECPSTIPPFCQAALLNEVIRTVYITMARNLSANQKCSSNNLTRSVFADLCEMRELVRDAVHTHVVVTTVVQTQAASLESLLRLSMATRPAAAVLAHELERRRGGPEGKRLRNTNVNEMAVLHMLASMISPQDYVQVRQEEQNENGCSGDTGYDGTKATRQRHHAETESDASSTTHTSTVTSTTAPDTTCAKPVLRSGVLDSNTQAGSSPCEHTDDETHTHVLPRVADAEPKASHSFTPAAWLAQMNKMISTLLAQEMEHRYHVSFLRLVVVIMTQIVHPGSWYWCAQPLLRELAHVQQHYFDLVPEDYIRAIWAFVSATRNCCDASSGRKSGFDDQDEHALKTVLTFGVRTALSFVDDEIANNPTSPMGKI